MKSLIAKALMVSGYDCELTELNLIQCFYDYVDSGVWHDLDLDTAKGDYEDGEITVEDMCKALIRLR